MSSNSTTFWAWTVSIAVHLIVLTTLSVARLTQPAAENPQPPTPIARVTRIKKLINTAAVIPKPKVKKPDRKQAQATKKLSTSKIFDNASLSLKNSTNQSPSLAGRAITQDEMEFYAAQASPRKVCYLVDCSGSMHGVFGKVREQLKEYIAQLKPDQYFCIIFFGSDRLFEFNAGSLRRAGPKTKALAYDFIDSIIPAGQTNTIAALERAMSIRDRTGDNPSAIYLLTDGFELAEGDRQYFSLRIANLLKRFAPITKINTIGFWPGTDDRRMLETIAEQSGGEFVSVTDDEN